MASDLRYYLERQSLVSENWPSLYRYQAEPRDITESAILQALPDGSLRTAFVYGISEGNDPVRFVSQSLPALDGGRLVFATADGFVSPPRVAGATTVHDCNMPHGVTPLRRGVRQSLFFLRVHRDSE